MPRAHADAPLPAWQRLDLRLCELFHDGCRRELRALFRWIGRLGRGPAWYGLALMLLAFHGETAAVPVLRMLVMGGLGSALYKWLKTRLARPRPFRRSEALATEPPPP